MNNRATICSRVHGLFHEANTLRFPFEARAVPDNGVYVLFENGEQGHGTSRIVRIGSHTGKGQLRPRLLQHYMLENKDRSIFRKNIGRALLARDRDPFLTQWNLDLTTRKARSLYAGMIDFAKQRQVELRVTDYIRSSFSFVTLRINDKEERLGVESMLIGTVSLCDECRPSVSWLGMYSPISKIRESGLWLVNELYKTPLSEEAFERLQEIVLYSATKS